MEWVEAAALSAKLPYTMGTAEKEKKIFLNFVFLYLAITVTITIDDMLEQ